MKEAEKIIELQNVSKVFRLPQEHRTTFKEHLFNLHKGNPYEELWALKNINLEIKKGEFISFIGPNGAGKTTLLRLISKVYVPTRGEVIVEGTTAPFLELGIGFQPELTAKDNIYLYGATLGLTRDVVQERFPDIIHFSELERYINQKVKNFSAGMEARLAFSISAHTDADILLVDEVLAVGDMSFQERCFNLFRKFKDQGKTIIFVSHNLDIVRQFSDRVGLLRNGSLEVLGESQGVISKYLDIAENIR
jgi:lipopolysaccharide transport system ATP-binding protein